MKIGITERGDAALDFDEMIESAINKKVDGIIMITKDPGLLAERLKRKPSISIPFIVNCTITGMKGFQGGLLEPNVPDPRISIRAYRDLIEEYGLERVVLRIDPISTASISLATMIALEAIGRVRISFIDKYPHVVKRLDDVNIDPSWVLPEKFHYDLQTRVEMLNKIQSLVDYEIEICGEPDMKCTGCVSYADLKAMELALPDKVSSFKQRTACACLGMKTELLSRRSQCEHGCLYCYWK